MDTEKFKHVFDKANFIRELGCELHALEKGYCEIHLPVKPMHLQQNGFVHAGVIATLADHAAGCAAATVAGDGQVVLSAEFKINFLRPGAGEKMICRSRVVKPGKMLSICQSEVFGVTGDDEKMVALAIVTIANTSVA